MPNKTQLQTLIHTYDTPNQGLAISGIEVEAEKGKLMQTNCGLSVNGP